MSRREIPSLRELCLRTVGSRKCNAEITFGTTKDGQESSASRLLRSFHKRGDKIKRLPCFGKGAARRSNANEVDLNHPFIATSSKVAEYCNPALDCLQSYIDSLVELGRLDDSKLGINFWREWKANVDPFGTARKRKRSDNERQPELGALSLHNGMIFEDTVAAMVKSGMGESVAVLDLTGIHTLTDPLIDQLLSIMPNLRRLSLKNCRRLTGKSLVSVARHLPSLTCLDIGGSYNITVADVLEQLPNMPNLQELYASGLGWTDLSLEQLCANRFWKGLGVGFSPGITPSGLRESLKSNSELERLSIPFCEDALDTSLLGFLGRSLKKVKALDIRGNSGVNSLTTWFDGRAATGARETQPLFCLARYSNVTSSSIEDTKRVHPMLALDLKVVLDAKGIGGGIKR